MKRIPLSKNGKNKGKFFALVDDDDFDWLNQWNWSVRKDKHTYYVIRIANKQSIHMHREVMKMTNPKILIDHEDQNGLNNQKYNLREATNGQNSANTRASGKSKYLGVAIAIHKRGKREHKYWVAQLFKGGKHMLKKHCKTEIEAAIAYNEAAKIHHGKFARLNIIIEPK